MTQLTEAQAWLDVIEDEANDLERGVHGFLCNRVNTLYRQMQISHETRETMRGRIYLFAPFEGDTGCYWSDQSGDDLAERVLAACFCLAMCEAGEAV